MWYYSIIYVWHEYVCIMYGCMISYVYHRYMSMVVYMYIWLYEYMNICVVLCEIVSVVYVCIWLYWRYVVM